MVSLADLIFNSSDPIDFSKIQNVLAKLSDDLAIQVKGAIDAGDKDHERWAQAALNQANAAALYALHLQNTGAKIIAVEDKLLLPSRKSQFVGYRVNEHSCTCEAGMHGKMCVHQTLAQAIRKSLDDLYQI